MKRLLTPYEQTQLARHGTVGSPVPDTTPIEYVTGVAEFCGLELSVSPAVLIPRVETEGLVEMALECLSEKLSAAKELRVLDVGTGSGAVIVSIAKHFEGSTLPIQFFATDISEAAVTIAMSNAQVLTSTPIQFVQDNLLEKSSGRFDLITANLPYIPSGAVKKLDKSVINHEPLLALDGGEDGFEVIKKLLQAAPAHLQPHGTVILELDTSHTQSFFSDFEEVFSVTFFNDCFDRHRFARLDLKN